MTPPIPDSCFLCGSQKGFSRLLHTRDFELGIGEVYQLLQCRVCKVVSIFPKPETHLLQKHYPASMSFYRTDAYFFSREILKIFGKREVIRILKLLPLGGSLLDVGCSYGQFLDLLRPHPGYHPYGLDFKAEASSGLETKGHQILSGSLEEMKLESEKFNVVRMNHVVEHLLDPVRALENAYRSLKSGGYLVGETPNIDSFEFKIFRKYWGGLSVPRHLYLFSKSTLNLLLSRVGFKEIRIFSRLNPAPWALGIQNLLIDNLHLKASCSGRKGWYPLLLILALPLQLPQFFLGNTGFVGFQCRK